ncbi:DUF2201 family putative metallopeptidase [Candidatus Poriferisocius sp.]|uniref:vWA domain-containing protein n=1 Tax=Candidatus Poriferisocius sp. TaxID=3101276 RepID=UPI003B02CEBE
MTSQPPAPHPEPQPGQGGTETDCESETEGGKKVIAARLWIARHRPYYTSALFSCPLSFTDQVEGFAIDGVWRIQINPSTAADLSVGEVAGCLIHELNHALRGHYGRSRRAGVPPEHHYIWNLAADCEINDDLRADGLSCRPGIVYPEDYELLPAKLAESYYRLLLKSAETIELPVVCCDSATRGPDRTHPQPGLSAARRQHLRRTTAQAILDHRHKYGWGSTPGGLARWAEKAGGPTADWRRILAHELRRGIQRQPGTGDWTYTRPPRRPQNGPVIAPGTHQPTADITVVIDTSASMSERELQQAVAETEAVLRQVGGQHPITVHSFDTEAHTAQRVLNARRIELAGGGGTDMASAIETTSAARPQPAVIIVITDGHTPWPPARQPGNNSTVIAVLTQPHTSHHVPGWITTIITNSR